VRFVLVLPALTALIGITAGWFLPRYVSPQRSTQVLTGAVVMTTLAILAALAQLGLAGLSEVPAIADAVGWCRALYHGQHGASPAAGILAVGGLAVALGAMERFRRRLRREHAEYAGVRGIEVVAADGPVAFAVPGRPGGVVIGDALLADLTTDGKDAVLAHERAHLRLHHHLYVHTAGICAAGLPLLRPLASRVRFMTERWADEVAAEEIGSRRVLAETIAQVALMSDAGLTRPLSFGGHHTTSRVRALVQPQPSSPLLASGAALSVLSVVASGSVVQLHHLATFFSHICPM
jgi:Zn-dependent protease with chaperone function